MHHRDSRARQWIAAAGRKAPMSECLDTEQVFAFLAGDLDDEARERVEIHIDECAVCRPVLAEAARRDRPRPSGDVVGRKSSPTREVDDRRAACPEPRASRRRTHRRWPLVAALGLVAIAAIGVWVAWSL